MTALKKLDDHSGRLRVPQAVIEIRHYGSERVNLEEARQQHEELAEIARSEYAAVVAWESSPEQSAARLEDLWRSVEPPQSAPLVGEEPGKDEIKTESPEPPRLGETSEPPKKERPPVFVHAEDADAAAARHLEDALGFLLGGGHVDALIDSRINAARETMPWNRGEVNRLAERLRAAITNASDTAAVTDGTLGLAALHDLDRRLTRFNQAARNAEIDGLRPRQSDGDPVLPYDLKVSEPMPLPRAKAVLDYMLDPDLRSFIRQDAGSAKKRNYQPNRPPEDQRQRVRDARDALLNGIDQAILDFSQQELNHPRRLSPPGQDAYKRRAEQLVLLAGIYNQVIVDTTGSTQARARLGRLPHANHAMYKELGDLASDALKDFKDWQPYETRFNRAMQLIGSGAGWRGPTREQLQNAWDAVLGDITTLSADARDRAVLIASVERIRRAFFEFQRLLLSVEEAAADPADV